MQLIEKAKAQIGQHLQNPFGANLLQHHSPKEVYFVEIEGIFYSCLSFQDNLTYCTFQPLQLAQK